MAIFSRKSSTNKPTQNQAITNGASFEPGVTSGVSAEMPYLEFSQLATGQISQHKQLSSFTRSKNSAKSASKPSRLRKLIGLPAYYWVLIAQLFVILPHSSHLPVWLIGLGLATLVFQLPKIKAKLSTQKRLKRSYQGIQLISFVAGLAGLWLTYQTAFGVDVGVAFLMLCLIGKLWELYQRRDAYVVLNLSLFVLASLFLMDQGLGTTIIAAIGALMVLFAFIALNDDGNVSGDGRLRTLGLLSGAALPLLVVLFLFFPRLPPLWSVQLSGSQATTGVSDSMSPGDFASLSQSTELAFRVEFPKGRPPQSALYWRGLVFSDFDGVTWRPSRESKGDNKSVWQGGPPPKWLEQAWATVPEAQKTDPETYQIILEPTQQNWLYGLDYPFAQVAGVGISPEFTLRKDQPVTQQLRYDALRFDAMRIDTELTPEDRQLNLALPARGNEQSHALAQRLFAQAGRDPVRYIDTIHAWINKTEFSYTLSPPPLPDDRVDSFLFDTKAGFCEHYSSSFTFLMRAAGIPARVVAGYQGGELGRGGKVWEVRQMDAHAWSEVWLEGRGWVRVDPTSFVAPERVEKGMESLTQQRGATMFGNGPTAQLSYQQFRMLQSLRRLSDQASYYWQKDVVGYDQDKQSNALLKWLNITSVMQQIMWMVALGVIMLAIIGLIIWQRRRRRWHPADLPLVQLSRRLARSEPELAFADDEGLLTWLDRLQAHSEDEQIQQAIATIQSDYRKLRYGRLSTVDPKEPNYQQALNELKQLASKIK